jgi:DNA mismatch repair ATPase MutS
MSIYVNVNTINHAINWKLAWLKCSLRLQEKTLRSKIQNKYITLETRKDGTKFTSKRMKEAAAELNEAAKQYSETQRTLIDSVRIRRRT